MSLFEHAKAASDFIAKNFTSKISCMISVRVNVLTGELSVVDRDTLTHTKAYKEMSAHAKMQHMASKQQVINFFDAERIQQMLGGYSYITKGIRIREDQPDEIGTHYGVSMVFENGELTQFGILVSHFDSTENLSVSGKRLGSAAYIDQLEKVLRRVESDTYSLYRSVSAGKEVTFKAPSNVSDDGALFLCERIARAPASFMDKKSLERALSTYEPMSRSKVVFTSKEAVRRTLDEFL